MVITCSIKLLPRNFAQKCQYNIISPRQLRWNLESTRSSSHYRRNIYIPVRIVPTKFILPTQVAPWSPHLSYASPWLLRLLLVRTANAIVCSHGRKHCLPHFCTSIPPVVFHLVATNLCFLFASKDIKVCWSILIVYCHKA